MKGFAPLLIIIIVLAILGTGIGGYVFVAEQKNPAPQSTESPGTSAESDTLPSAAPQEKNPDTLLGFWKVSQVFLVNQKGEFKEAAVPFPLFTEFKKGYICRNWEIKEDTGQCKGYQPVIIQGNIIDVRDPASPVTFQWNIVGGKLELIEIESGTSKPKTKTISEKVVRVDFSMPVPKAPTPSKITLDPKMLIGLWASGKAFGYDPRDEEWKESQGTTIASYQEFTAKTLCSSWHVMSGDEPEAGRFKCLSASPYTVSGDVISFELPGLSGSKETAYYRWNIVDTKLELAVGISDKPFLKYIYVKAPVSWPTDPFALEFSDPNAVHKGASFKVKGERKTTETINMWLTDGAGNILSAEIEFGFCTTLGMQSDICITEPSGRADYDSRPDSPQCPFPEIPFGSHPQIGQAVCFVPQTDGQFQVELLIKNPGIYVLHAKATQSGIETTLPIGIN